MWWLILILFIIFGIWVWTLDVPGLEPIVKPLPPPAKKLPGPELSWQYIVANIPREQQTMDQKICVANGRREEQQQINHQQFLRDSERSDHTMRNRPWHN